MTDITAWLRSTFSDKLNGANLVLFPRLHFFAIAKASLVAPVDTEYVTVTAQEITDTMWSERNFFANGKPQDGNSARPAVGSSSTAKVKQKMSQDFVTWMSNNIKSSITSIYTNEGHIWKIIPF